MGGIVRPVDIRHLTELTFDNIASVPYDNTLRDIAALLRERYRHRRVRAIRRIILADSV